MSVVARTPLAEKVTIKVGQKHTEVFILPRDAVDNLLLFIKNCQPRILKDNEALRLEDIKPSLKDSAQRIASILRGARLKKNMTQIKLAEELNITQSDLSKMEHGKRPIGKKLAMRLSQILEIDYRVFL